MVRDARGRNLFFSTDIAAGIREADIIFVCVNTPTKTFGQGAGMAADLQYWEKTARQILANSDRAKIVVEKSTLPVRTAEAMERILQSNKHGHALRGAFQPRVPGRRHGGPRHGGARPGADRRARDRGRACRRRQEIVDIFARWVPRERILTTNLWSSELSKLVANAFLAQRISSINAISALCEKTGADVTEVSFAVGSDSRIGPRFLQRQRGLWRLLLPEGYPQPGLHLRAATAWTKWPTTGSRWCA